MRTIIQLALMALMLGTVAVNNAAIAGELRTGHLLPIDASVDSLQHAQSVGVLLSDNTRDNLSYLERYHDMALNGAKGALDGRIRQAFVNSSDPELAIEQARACDRGPRRGPLHGVPVGVKDVIDTADMPTDCNSPIYKGHRPAKDAACVARLRQAGGSYSGATAKSGAPLTMSK